MRQPSGEPQIPATARVIEISGLPADKLADQTLLLSLGQVFGGDPSGELEGDFCTLKVTRKKNAPITPDQRDLLRTSIIRQTRANVRIIFYQ